MDRARLSSVPLCGALLLAALTAGAQPRLSAKPEIRRELSTTTGEGVEGIKGLRATFYVAAPPDRVLDVLWDVRRFPEMFPDIKDMKVLAGRDAQLDVRFRVDAVLAEVTYTLRRTVDRERRLIRWREIAGDLERVRGSWRVEATDDPGTSRVTYASFVSVSAFVPESVYRDIAIGKVEELTERVRAAVRAPAAARTAGSGG